MLAIPLHIWTISYFRSIQETLENTEGAIKKGQSQEPGNTGFIIEAPVPSQESEGSRIFVLGISILLFLRHSDWILE